MFSSRQSGLSRRSGVEKSKSSGETQYFKEVLNKVGISLQFSDSPNVYSKEASLITRDLQRELEQHENYPTNILEFVNGLKSLCSRSEKHLKKALSPSVNNEGGRQQECLFRVLLGVDCLQSAAAELLLEASVPAAVEEHDDTSRLRILLNPLRYLAYVKKPHALAESLLQLLEAAREQAQLELLAMFPELLPDGEYESAAEGICRLLEERPSLTAAAVDCLGCLGLGAESRTKLQERLLGGAEAAGSLDHLPAVLSFLLSECKPSDAPRVLARVRPALDSALSSAPEHDSQRLLAFRELRRLCSRQLGEAWVQLLSTLRRPEDHRPVDLLVLLMLHGAAQRRGAIEIIFRRKVRSGQLRPALIVDAISRHLAPQMYHDYLRSAVALGAALLLGGGTELEVARVLFNAFFSHKHADEPTRRQVLDALVAWPGGKAAAALGVLLSLESHLLRPHALQLMGLLDRLETLPLSEAAQLFELLSTLLWDGESGNSGGSLQADMHMLVRKQLASSRRGVRLRGVLAAVAVAGRMAASETAEQVDDSVSSDVSYSSTSDLPAGQIRQAAALLELAAEGVGEARGLYYDRLAHIIVNGPTLDRRFLSWLVESVTADFQTAYVVGEIPQAHHDLAFVVQHNLNESEAVNDPIIINIGELTAKESSGVICTLASLFRLVRVLHQRHYDGSLSSVDALLGCGIAFPDADPDTDLDNYGLEDSRVISDCTFHCINWFRELVSAFVTQKGQSIRRKVLKRISALLQLEEAMRRYARQLPDHKLPAVSFYHVNVSRSVAATSMEPPKAKRKKVNNKTQQTSGASQPAKGNKRPTKETAILSFRELDTDVMLLLKHPLSFEETDNDTELETLCLAQFNYILHDLVYKLRVLDKGATNLSHVYPAVKPDYLIKDLVHLAPYIDGHLTNITQQIRLLLSKCDGIEDAHDMFQPAAIQLKESLALVLETLRLMLRWPGFSTRLPLLRDLLRALLPESQGTQLRSAERLLLALATRLSETADCCLTLTAAVSLTGLVRSLADLTNDRTASSAKLATLGGKLLERKWYSPEGLPEGGATANLAISNLVKAYLEQRDVASIGSAVSWVHAEMGRLETKDDHLESFKCITKANFPVLYRGLCSGLQDALKSELSAGRTDTQHLEAWSQTATTLHALMDVVKTHESRANLTSFLRRSTGILKLFLSHGLPMLEIRLRAKPERVLEILKVMQQSTRFVHSLCCHSKVTKEAALVAHVPQMRLTLETLVYRVKALLAANNCSQAFWMGNLKNKDLAGQEISSQVTNESVEDSERREEQDLPPDDSEESDGGEQDQNEDSVANDSASEIF